MITEKYPQSLSEDPNLLEDMETLSLLVVPLENLISTHVSEFENNRNF